ncbi:RNA polymerase-binding protein DksA [Paucibacter sp. M5-1]|uniref:RNA polymerase-binding protein DksA n=1 Tax=Paucibacter sp. M5-1 TaxID=3015998 RepID=UPI0022B91761|nr:RNA polymerase-binding protein DksA [Paucibacter sp. M5-1]MCZ7884311.1 RNA polymerase-binding protein DksA [Paucibacter sp. M5-1]
MSKTPAPKPTPTTAPADEGRPTVKAGKSSHSGSSAKAKAAALDSSSSASVATLEAAAPPLGSSRFADRFAPPKPPTRQMSTPVIESPKSAAKADPKLVNAWKTKAGHELTDAEVMAMPEAEYMNDKQIEFFRAKLTALKDGVLSNAGETTEHLREDTSIVPDPADRATIEEEHALELRTRDRERKLLKKIMQSLARLDTGEYGYCDETGEPIGLGRLIARPTANLSLEAQQRRELKQKMFGD